jgi:hypothetical protein
MDRIHHQLVEHEIRRLNPNGKRRAMLRKTLLYILFPLAFIAVAVLLAAHFFSSPAKFIVANSDSEPVKVVVQWRDKTKNMGTLLPSTSTEFFIEDETAMTIEIVRANGTALREGNIHFAPDTVTRVDITRTSVNIKRGSDE